MTTATPTDLRAIAKGCIKMIPMMEAMAPLALVKAADEIDRLNAMLLWMADVEPQLVDAAREKFGIEQHAKIDAAVDDMVEKYPKTLDHLRRS